MATTRVRKYTPEILEAEIARPKGRGGRPRKYATEEERKKALNEASKRRYWRQRYTQGCLELPEEYALRERSYNTNDERRVAQIHRAIQYHQQHPENHRLSVMVCKYKQNQA